MREVRTDYTPGDEPVPVGTVVWYGVLMSEREARFEVIDHLEPQKHPSPPPFPAPTLDEAYPDGVAYLLWRVGAPKKLGNRDGNEYGWVRRTSFRVADEDRKGEESGG